MKQKILLHACCAVCCAYPIQKLINLGYEPVIYFCNPNIYPKQEYDRRLNELNDYAIKQGYVLIIEEKNLTPDWYNFIKGLEQEPEKGLRCEKCFDFRLERTIKKAIELKISLISTTLTVSPHKSSKTIFKVLKQLKEKYNIDYLPLDFKKENGFLITSQIATKENFYRQNYCGCEFSIRRN